MPSFLKFLLSSNILVNPPQSSLLRCSSGAILSVRGMLSALWWVSKGLAAAPPATLWSMGVSTSRNPRSWRKWRISEIICERLTNRSALSWFDMRSRWRLRYLVSRSETPCHLSGMGRSAFERTVSLATLTDGSPFPVVNVSPSIPIQSPMSMSFHAAHSVSVRPFWFRYPWIRPWTSPMVKKTLFPMSLMASRRPARVTGMSFSKLALISPGVVVTGNFCPNGSMPSSRSWFIFSVRTAISSCSVDCVSCSLMVKRRLVIFVDFATVDYEDLLIIILWVVDVDGMIL